MLSHYIRRDKNLKISGNVLFIILIAVALFGALSFAITQSSNSGSNSATRDKAKIIASEILQYASTVEQAIERMALINEVSVEYLDVSAAGIVQQPANANCSSDRCKLFSPSGGGIKAKALPPEATDMSKTNWWKVGNQSKAYFMIVRWDDIGTDLADLVLLYGAVTDEVCEEINVMLGLKSYGDPAIYEGHGAFVEHGGFLVPYPNPAGRLGDEEAVVKGKHSFCSQASSASAWGNYFYHVLVAR